MNATTAAPDSHPAPTKATWACLIIAWVLFLIPFPGAGLFIGWPLNLVAFILAIVVMTRGRTAAGLIPLLCSIVVSPIVYFIGLAIFAAALSGAGNASTATAAVSPSAQVQAAEEPATEISASALFAAYDANEIAADRQYKGKRLRITGAVESISSDFGDDPQISLTTGDMFQTVQVMGLSKQLAMGLSKGQTITVDCIGDGEVIGTPMVKDCAPASQ